MKECLLYMFLFVSLFGCSQTDNEIQNIRNKRFYAIHVHRIGLGVETSIYNNIRVSPRLFYELGSFRNRFSINGGLKYVYNRPLLHTTDEIVIGHYLAPFMSAQIHFGRWNSGCVYIGGEIAYNFAIAGNHYLSPIEKKSLDNDIVNSHCSIRPKLGVKFENWDLNFHYEYDFAPAWNQKYVFESFKFDYESLRASIFERFRFGVFIAYLIPF